jgi:hypothetical protein
MKLYGYRLRKNFDDKPFIQCKEVEVKKETAKMYYLDGAIFGRSTIKKSEIDKPINCDEWGITMVFPHENKEYFYNKIAKLFLLKEMVQEFYNTIK